MDYFIVKDRNTGLYFRGKGDNKWGKYFNQASIYKSRKRAEETADWENKERGADCIVVPIEIIEKVE